MRAGDGIISHEDLRTYEAKWREPVVFDYRGRRVISMPPPSSGGLTLALMANMLEGWNPSPDWHDPDMVHRTAEAMRRAFADRNQLMGDPDFVDVPAARFLSEEYAGRLRASIDPARATPSDSVRPGLQSSVEGNHTTHFSVVDALGNAVAFTTTLNELYGSAVTVSGAGFLLNDEMDDFTSRVGQPNLFGLVQGEANAIVPGKRMLSAMTPTIVLDSADAPLLITGARGGPRIITAVLQVLSNVIDYDMPIDAAVRAPRVHHQHLPDVLWFETRGLSTEDSAALAAKGHDVRATGGVGHAPAIMRTDSGWVGMPDPRNGGKASGY
jgi:gamma-glutamyltranspeptidase/glutathione hydrolase